MVFVDPFVAYKDAFHIGRFEFANIHKYTQLRETEDCKTLMSIYLN